MALDALLDTSIELVILTGPAGVVKPLLALACALEMVIEKGVYDKVIVTRNTLKLPNRLAFYLAPRKRKWRLGWLP